MNMFVTLKLNVGDDPVGDGATWSEKRDRPKHEIILTPDGAVDLVMNDIVRAGLARLLEHTGVRWEVLSTVSSEQS